MLALLEEAARFAIPTKINDVRGFWLCAIGIRSDGTRVRSCNGAVYSTTINNYQLIPTSHAECRVINKMDVGGTLYVARVKRLDRSLGNASACMMCRNKIKAHGISKVYYTINNFQYGLWLVKKDLDITFGEYINV